MFELNDSALYWLNRYLDIRNDYNTFLIVSFMTSKNFNVHPEGPMTTRSVERMIRKTVREAGIDKIVTPMTFRHTKVYNLYKRGSTSEEISEVMGYNPTSNTFRRIHKLQGKKYIARIEMRKPKK